MRNANGQLKHFKALQEVDLAIAASIDLRLTLHVLLDQLRSVLDVDALQVLLFDPAEQTLVFGDSLGFRTSAFRHTRLRPGQGLAGRALAERRIVQAHEIRRDAGPFACVPLLSAEGFASYVAAPLFSPADEAEGVLEIFHRQPLTPSDEWLEFVLTLARKAAMAINNARLFEALQKDSLDLLAAYDSTLRKWANVLEQHERKPLGHSLALAEQTARLAKAMGLGHEPCAYMRCGALLHDVGNLAVSQEILLKPAPLCEHEQAAVRQHPVYAYEMLSRIALLRPAIDIPYCHHEKWDGTGYPRGLKGEQIPLAARIFAVADVFDALRSPRPWRQAWPAAKAKEHVASLAGVHFDPRVVEAFMTMETAAALP